ncbi:hypothetical protein B9Z19DRAFT_1075093 [Tuber borchii]|uniref:Uncharacterized protein n=1 Tax=Tuber borchii TaxID=42251 RepID=A0A2T7A3P8_TUBBO|nr:hypothetical protein B9Z19DRAFT_1075093 [Tuber borchii]
MIHASIIPAARFRSLYYYIIVVLYPSLCLYLSLSPPQISAGTNAGIILSVVMIIIEV